MEDEKIVSMFLLRDEQAVAAANDKYGKLLCGIASRILDSQSDAEECLNDSLLALWNSIPPNQPDDLRSYACKIIRNLSLKRLSYNLAEKRSQNAGVPLTELEAVLPDESALEALRRVDLSIVVDEFLKTQPPEARAVFIRRYFFFDSVGEIARSIGISESKVKSALFRTRNKLKKCLDMKGSAL